VVLLFAIVGFWDVFQQTPRAVKVAPPSLVTVPPLVAVACDIEDIAAVVTAAYAAPIHDGMVEGVTCKN
jgi:hypothetical protein